MTDRERLDWLQRMVFDERGAPDIGTVVIDGTLTSPHISVEVGVRLFVGYGDDIRAAIDSAMAHEKSRGSVAMMSDRRPTEGTPDA